MKPPVTPTVLDIPEEQMPITVSHPYWVYVVDDVETKIEIRIRDVSIVLSKEQAQKLKEDLIKCG